MSGLPVFWLSWWDNPNGANGVKLAPEQEERFEAWVSGYRYRYDDTGEVEECSMCARVEAETEAEAWAMVNCMYPGASGDVRFTNKEAPGWRPGDRFPSRKSAVSP
jgi:hypothetical protein